MIDETGVITSLSFYLAFSASMSVIDDFSPIENGDTILIHSKAKERGGFSWQF
jgi:hypothetical protein